MQNLSPSQSLFSRIYLEKISLASLIETLDLRIKVQTVLSHAQSKRKVALSGLCGSLGSLLLAELFRSTSAPMLIVAKDERLELYENDLHILLGEASIMDFEREPSLTLSALLAGEKKIILTSPSELCRKVLAQETAIERRMHLRRGETIGYDTLQAFLQNNGFERKEFVEEEGDYAVRGSIIDVFSFGALKL